MDKPDLYKTKPMEHQLAGLHKAKGKRGFAYNCEQGTGKTWIAINEAAQLWGEGKINGLLVFADNGVHTNWIVEELPKHMPDWARWRSRGWNANANKPEQADFETILNADPKTHDSTELRIAAFNWESLAAKRSLDIIKRFINSTNNLMIVADESQAIANPSTKRVKELEKIKMAACVRRTMTGTPILKAPFDAFAQYRFIDPTILRTTSFVAFKAEYADLIPHDNPMMVKLAKRVKGGFLPSLVAKNEETGLPMYKNLDKLSKLIDPYTFRVLKVDCLDLPDKVYTQSFFDMLPAQRATYRKMEKEFRMLFQDQESPVSKLTALGKLSQISSGFLIDPERKVQLLMPAKENPKLQLLKDRLKHSIEELEKQVIVWCHYREELAQVCQMCEQEGWSHASYFGDTSKDDRTKAIKDFQAGNVKAFVAQLQAGSTGITLTAAQYVIYYSNTFSSGDRWQSEDRAHRIGQTSSVLYEDLLGNGTRDLVIVHALKNKKDIAAIINGDARELLKV